MIQVYEICVFKPSLDPITSRSKYDSSGSPADFIRDYSPELSLKSRQKQIVEPSS